MLIICHQGPVLSLRLLYLHGLLQMHAHHVTIEELLAPSTVILPAYWQHNWILCRSAEKG